ncbi:MAG TPA: KGG domain-containing protein [Vicinamibacterales bacterium]|nr:KGG domain-containing protein [Vicinamibacterales bacterium]
MANTSKRGFASMDPTKQREIASKGGRAAHAKGTAHEFTSDEARVAGRKGGEAVSRDRAHMSAIGREGGHSRGRARQPQSGEENAVSGSGIDTERPSYERASDRGTSASAASSSRSERGGDNAPARSESSPGRTHF